MLIYMFLSPGNVNPEDQLYPGQVSFVTIESLRILANLFSSLSGSHPSRFTLDCSRLCPMDVVCQALLSQGPTQ